ncbi:hypothetical protein OPQ81_008579 [Rhizoctonia solani]|nr:hypothetical protein OPQ81_008579 [Rhizoctonia solani]
MSEITTDTILTQVEKSSATKPSLTNLHETTGTPSVTQVDLQTRLRRSDRSRTRTIRAKEGGYGKFSLPIYDRITNTSFIDDELAVNKRRATRAGNTRARNEKNKAHTHSDAESVGLQFASAPSEIDNDGRDLSRSPTPIATAEEPEAQTTRNALQEKVTRKFDQVVQNSGTQTLMEVNDALSADSAYTSQPKEQDIEARFLPPVEVGVGGGFHLDHPTRRSRNHLTYRGSRTIATPDSPIPNKSTHSDNYSEPLHIQPFSTPKRGAPSLPLDPFRGLQSRFFPRTGLFLGYPDDQGSHQSPSTAPSQPLRTHSPTPSLTRELVSNGSSRRNQPMCREDSVTHRSESSKSLGDPIPTPSSGFQSFVTTSGATSHSISSKAPQPLTPTTGGKVYNTRLNITEINSQRVSSREVSRHRASSQARRRGKGTTRARTQIPTRIQTPAPIARAERTGDDNLDLLDDFDEGQFVVDSAKKGVLVDTPGYRKPIAQELSGHERSLWKETLGLTWAFSMGEGNFQTRAVYASWIGPCYSKLLELKLPNLDTTAMTMSDDMKTIILNSLCNMRYQDYHRLCVSVRDYYELKNPSTPDERENVKDKISELCPLYFHYRETNDPVDPYEGQIMLIGLESMFFWGPNAIGAKYPALFRRDEDDPRDERKHLAVLAYVATMVQFCLEEWTKGYFKKGALDATIQQSVWLCHYDGLKNVSLIARKRLINTYNKWVQIAYDASQAQTRYSKKRYVQDVVQKKDVRPDTPSRSHTPIESH